MAVNSDLSYKCHRIPSLAPLWNIWELRSMKERSKRILKPIHICVFGKPLLLIMFMTTLQHKSTFMKTQQSRLYFQFWRVITQQSWLMDRQVQVKLILWRASNTMQEILREVLSQEVWRKSSDSFKCKVIKTLLSW